MMIAAPARTVTRPLQVASSTTFPGRCLAVLVQRGGTSWFGRTVDLRPGNEGGLLEHM